MLTPDWPRNKCGIVHNIPSHAPRLTSHLVPSPPPFASPLMLSRAVSRASGIFARRGPVSARAFLSSVSIPKPTSSNEFNVPLRAAPATLPCPSARAHAKTFAELMSALAPAGTHAPGVADPTVAVAERKAARPAAMETLAKSAPVADVTTTAADGSVAVKGTTLTVAYSPTSVSAATEVAEGSAVAVFISTAEFAALPAATKAVLTAQAFAGKPGQAAVVPATSGAGVFIYAGVGDVIDGVSSTASAYVSIPVLRSALHAAIGKAKGLKTTAVTVGLPSYPVASKGPVSSGSGMGVKPVAAPKADEDKAAAAVPVGTPACPASAEALFEALATVAVSSAWRWDKYWKAESSAAKNAPLATVTLAAATAGPFATAAAAAAAALPNAVGVAESVLAAREFGNERPDVLHPAAAEQLARSLAAAHSDVLTVRVLQADELTAQGYNLITAVGQAATVPPRIVALTYDGTKGAAKEGECVALVGKGLCFDSGGLNLKPTGSMENMFMDKCGAAAVFGTMRALAVTRPAVKVIGVLALAENAIDAKSYKPYAIIDSHAGSVQVGNTDAEGRLCLADALTFVQNEYRPTHIVDIATLTGACMIALGEHAAGLFANSDEFASALASAGAKGGERLWRMPVFPEHTEEIAGEDADISSTGKTRYAGASTAAAFLQHYIQPGVQWAHVDIAGPATGSGKGISPKNATGFGVFSMYNFVTGKK